MAYGIAVIFLIIHILMFFIFTKCEIIPLVKFNIFSICFYVFMLFVVYKEWFRVYTVAVYLEVVAHMTFAIILTGWNGSFQITFLGMNVLAFYVEYSGRSLKVKHFRVMPLCVLGIVMYIASYIHLHYYPAIYSLPENTEFFLTLLWSSVVLFISLFVMQLLVIIAHDSEEKLAYQLSHDKLTGLPNRYYLSSQLENLKKENNNFWLSISDIDDFKEINDTYGHSCGDYVLKSIGDLLANKDVLCCRWGGEEFLFLGKADEKHADPENYMEEIRKEIENHSFEYEGKQIHITMTFGLSTFTNCEDLDNVLRDADDKLYIGKQSGKNKLVTSK